MNYKTIKINPKSIKTQSKINQKESQYQSKIDQKSTQHRPKIDQNHRWNEKCRALRLGRRLGGVLEESKGPT